MEGDGEVDVDGVCFGKTFVIELDGDETDVGVNSKFFKIGEFRASNDSLMISNDSFLFTDSG